TSLKTIEAWRAGSFFLGVFLIWVAVASPLADFDHEFLTVHMIQHLLLMTFAAPLILLGEPVMLLLRGLRLRPACIPRTAFGARFSPELLTLGTRIIFCWLAAIGALVVWHIPAVLALGMRSHAWHLFQQASFLTTGLLFWWPVVQPWLGAGKQIDWSI